MSAGLRSMHSTRKTVVALHLCEVACHMSSYTTTWLQDQIYQVCNQRVTDAQIVLPEDYVSAHIPHSFQTSCHLHSA